MTSRKPAGRSFESWVERQVREAAERGEFDGLRGSGQPLRNLDRPFSAEEWAADKARREGFDVSAMLPPALALRREREVLLRDLGELRSAAEVDAVVADFNDRVRELYRRPADGPLVVVALLDAAEVRERWGRARPAPAPVQEAPGPVVRRRWWRRAR
ncbi:DnaJ family domain-containing protein [Kineococcus auxinigenes]|uniref:DnaJ family domain-containing protein n=1 Tax=unclassified Kineococcus TaxID=2621656 RepID=UPI003D7C894D